MSRGCRSLCQFFLSCIVPCLVITCIVCVVGTCARRIGIDSGYFILDASTSVDPDIFVQLESQFAYIWSCSPVLGGTVRNDLECAVDPQFLTELSANAARIQLDPVAFIPHFDEQSVSNYLITLTVRSTLYGMIRESSRSIHVYIEPGSPPEVRIARVISLASDSH
eukprot:SAG31_NODE_20223_length_580_cov_1.654886_1_plen_165_part_01